MKNSIDIVAFIKAIFGEKFTGHITVLVDKYGTEIKTEKYKSDVFRVLDQNGDVGSEELEQVRRQGFAENRGESQVGMCSIAAPVRDRMGRVVASVSVAEHVDDVDAGLRHLAGPVIETAKRVSAGLGWTW